MGKTLYQKVYDSHIVFQQEGELPTLYIDRQLVHEVTSPQAFAGIEQAGRKLHRPDLHLATMDHDISTRSQTIEACSPMAQEQIKALMSIPRNLVLSSLVLVKKTKVLFISLDHRPVLHCQALH